MELWLFFLIIPGCLDYREGVLKDNMKTIFTDCFTGAKGAGKTSLIQSIQKRQFSQNRSVLFLNEKGSIPYSVSNPDFLRIYPILGGCICCSGQTELIHFMQESMAEDNPKRFIIELCGAGRIKDLLPLLHLIPDCGPGLFCHILNMQHLPARMHIMGSLLWNQIAEAPIIIMNRCNALLPEQFMSCLQSIREHNKNALILPLNEKNLADTRILSMNFYQELCPEYQNYFTPIGQLKYENLFSFSENQLSSKYIDSDRSERRKIKIRIRF